MAVTFFEQVFGATLATVYSQLLWLNLTGICVLAALIGGPVTGTYRLKQFHFHWGGADERGSEHTIGGTKFPCEVNTFSYVSLFSGGIHSKDNVLIK